MYLVCLKRKLHPQISTDVCLSVKCSKLVKIHNRIGDYWECDFKPRPHRSNKEIERRREDRRKDE